MSEAVCLHFCSVVDASYGVSEPLHAEIVPLNVLHIAKFQLIHMTLNRPE
jgi:hypothetical protein